jgi:hypothetical protein
MGQYAGESVKTASQRAGPLGLIFPIPRYPGLTAGPSHCRAFGANTQ